MSISNLLDSVTYPAWITSSFPIIRAIFVALMAICAVGVIIIVLAQDMTSGGGANAITGHNESFYAMNKGGTREGRLKKLIVIFSIAVVVLVLLYFVTFIIWPAAI